MITKDIFGRKMLEFDIRCWSFRLFTKRFAAPYGYFAYGMYCVGVGPFGAMIWPPRKLVAAARQRGEEPTEAKEGAE